MNAKNTIFLSLMGLGMLVHGCKKAVEDRIVNQWKLVSIDDNSSYAEHPGTGFTVYADGSFVRKDYVHIIQSQNDIRELRGYWTKEKDVITFWINDRVNVTTMVGGLDSTYSSPCSDTWTLVRVSNKELVLDHQQSSLGCFMDSNHGTTFTFKKI